LQNEKALSDLSTRLSTIINGELSADKIILPKIPLNKEDVHNVLQEHPVLTAENENFVLVNHSQSNILFSCDKNFNLLTKLETINVNGTFQYCEKHFLQIITVHGLIEDYYIPLAFFFYFLLKKL